MGQQALANQHFAVPGNPRLGAIRVVRNRVVDPSIVVLILAAGIATTFASLYCQSIAFTIFVNFRLMDVCAIACLLSAGVYRLSRDSNKSHYASPGEKTVFFTLFMLVAYGIFQTCRGIPTYGTFAIGIARYSFLDFFWIPTMIAILDTEARLSTFLSAMLTLVPIAWLLRMGLFLFGSPVLNDNGEVDEFARFLEAAASLSLSAFAVVLYPMALVGWSGRKLCGLPTTGLAIFSLGFTLYSQQRSVWMSLIGVMVFLFFFLVIRTSGRAQRRVVRGFFLTLGFVALVLMAAVILSPGVAAHRLAFVQGLETDPSGYWRIQGWIWGMKRVLSLNPIFGLGFGEHGFPDPNVPDNFILVPDHNQFVTACRTGGLLGLSLFLLALTLCYRFTLRSIRLCGDSFSRLRMIGLLGMFIMSVIFCMFYNQPTMLWMSFGLIVAASRIEASKAYANRNHQP